MPQLKILDLSKNFSLTTLAQKALEDALKNHFNILVGDKRVPRVSICISGGGGRQW